MENYDTYKEMIEERSIAIDNGQEHLWLRKYFPEKWYEKHDRINEAIHNSLTKIMLERNHVNKETDKSNS